MTKYRVETGRLAEGVWEGVIAAEDGGGDLPTLAAVHLGLPVEGLSIEPIEAGRWRVRLPVPARAFSDGVQTVLLTEAATGQTLARVVIVAGEVVADDLMAELALLRAELDVVKHALRRHLRDHG